MKLPPPKDDPVWSRLRAHDVEELWDPSLAPHVASSYGARTAFMFQLVRELAGPGGRVLDVGCAQGTLGLMLAEVGLRVTLLDVRPEGLEYARARHESGDVEFCVGRLGDGVPAAGGFDVVVLTEVIEHVPAPSELLRQVRRKLRPGGALCLTTPNADYLLARLPSYGRAPQVVIDTAERDSADGDAHRYLFTSEELASVVRSVGLRVERSGFFLPAWIEGHVKTRYLHRALFRLRRQPLRLKAALPPAMARASRWVCSSQWLVAREPGPDADRDGP